MADRNYLAELSDADLAALRAGRLDKSGGMRRLRVLNGAEAQYKKQQAQATAAPDVSPTGDIRLGATNPDGSLMQSSDLRERAAAGLRAGQPASAPAAQALNSLPSRSEFGNVQITKANGDIVNYRSSNPDIGGGDTKAIAEKGAPAPAVAVVPRGTGTNDISTGTPSLAVPPAQAFGDTSIGSGGPAKASLSAPAGETFGATALPALRATSGVPAPPAAVTPSAAAVAGQKVNAALQGTADYLTARPDITDAARTIGSGIASGARAVSDFVGGALGRSTPAGASRAQAADFQQPSSVNPVPVTPTTPIADPDKSNDAITRFGQTDEDFRKNKIAFAGGF